MDRVERYIRFLSQTMLILSTAILAGLMFLTVADIGGRTFGYSLKGAYQICELAQVGLICLAWPFTTLTDAHVKVDLFIVNFPSWLRHKIHILTCAISMVIFVIISWQGILLIKMTVGLGELVGVVNIPVYPFQIVIPLGAFVTSLVLLMQLIKLIRGRENNDGGV